jgi:L-threonylcarbamoyladenylate synthase
MARILDAAASDLRRLLGDVLRGGGVVIMPCDTIYGFVGVAPDTEGRIRAAKGRGEDKPFIQLVPEIGWLPRLSPASPPAGILGLWPGPLTLILPATGGGTVAVRLPDDELLRALMRDAGKPFYSSSVNLAGSPALWRVSAIVDTFGESVDLVVDAGDRPGGIASTIVDLSVPPHRVVRQGALRVPDELLEG